KSTFAPPQMDEPPADFFLTDAEREELGIAPPQESVTITPEILQEREIVRILINYGAELATWEGEGDIPVAPYLLSAIEDVDFVDKACAYIIGVFKKKMEDYELPEPKFFYSHEDKDVQELAISCVASPYELSRNWNDDKRKIYVSQEREHLKPLIEQAIYRIKKRKVERDMLKIREELKQNLSDAEVEGLMAKYAKLKEVEQLLGSYLGNTIVK